MTESVPSECERGLLRLSIIVDSSIGGAARRGAVVEGSAVRALDPFVIMVDNTAKCRGGDRRTLAKRVCEVSEKGYQEKKIVDTVILF